MHVCIMNLMPTLSMILPSWLAYLRWLVNEVGGHVVIITNLNENAYNLKMKVADFKRTNMLALPQIWGWCCLPKRGVQAIVAANLKEDIMSPLSSTSKEARVVNMKEEAMHHRYQH